MSKLIVLLTLLLFALVASAETKPEVMLMAAQYPPAECSGALAGSQFCGAMPSESKLILWVHVKDGVGSQVEVDAEVNGKPQVYVVKVPYQNGAWSAVTFRVRDTVKLSEFRLLKLTVGDLVVDTPKYGLAYR